MKTIDIMRKNLLNLDSLHPSHPRSLDPVQHASGRFSPGGVGVRGVFCLTMYGDLLTRKTLSRSPSPTSYPNSQSDVQSSGEEDSFA